MATPIHNKNAETICEAYRDHICCIFGGSSRILTDNGSEFKNQEMKQVCETLGVKHIFSPVYTPESNGHLEGWHRFFKACIVKYIFGGGIEWEELVPLAVSAYNFFLCQSSKESPFVLMFSRDPITPVAKLLEPKPRYYGEKGTSLKMDNLRRLYAIVVENIRKARQKKPQLNKLKPHSFKVNDMVLVKDPDSAVFQPRYQPNYRVTAVFGDNRIEVQDEKGHESIRRSSHIKYIEPSEKIVQQLPSKEILQKYGRSSRLVIAAKDIPDLQFKVNKDSEFPEHSQNLLDTVGEVMEVMETNVLTKTVRGSTVTVANNEYREGSQNSWSCAVGEALECKTDWKIVEVNSATNLQKKASKYREHSQNLWSDGIGVAVEHTEEIAALMTNENMQLRSSEDSKSSQKSQIQWGQTDTRATDVTNKDWCEQYLRRTSEFQEHSLNSQMEMNTPQVTQDDLSIQGTCNSESSKSSHKSSSCVGSNVSVPKFSWFKSMSQIVGLTAAWHQNKVEGSLVGANTVSGTKANITSVHSEFNFFL